MREPLDDWAEVPDRPAADEMPQHHQADAPEDDEPTASAGDFAPDANAPEVPDPAEALEGPGQ
jgi:hypothetical protein